MSVAQAPQDGRGPVLVHSLGELMRAHKSESVLLAKSVMVVVHGCGVPYWDTTSR